MAPQSVWIALYWTAISTFRIFITINNKLFHVWQSFSQPPTRDNKPHYQNTMVKSKRKPQRREVKLENRQRKEQEIESLKTRVVQEAPARGYAPPLSQIVAFPALSLSQATQQGLLEAKFTSMTAIQNACIPHALAGRDILGAAKTGSGKTRKYFVSLQI